MNASVEIKDAGKLLEAVQDGIRGAVLAGARTGAMRARVILVRRTPRDQGQLRAAWKVSGVGLGRNEVARLSNDAPYAGIVELGARPHGVSREGFEAIADWVRRHLGFSGGGSAGPGAGRSGPKERFVRRSAGVGEGPRQRLNLGAADRMVQSITWAIVQKLKTRGQQPTYFVKGSMPEVERAVVRETERALREALRGVKGGK